MVVPSLWRWGGFLLPRRSFLTLSLAWGQDWLQWRGPNRDGAVGATPQSWPEKLIPKWKIAIGEGHSSPIAAGERIFVFTREAEEEVLRAVEPATGKVAWRQAYAAPYTMNPAATRHGKGPKSTPLAHGDHVFTLGIDGILTSWDAATGRRRWQKPFGSPLYGAAMSPLVADALLVGQWGRHDAGAVTALDAASGEIRWRWGGDGPGYGSPVVAEFEGVKQVICQTQKNVAGLSLRAGQLLWQIPFTTDYHQNAVTPLVWRDLLIVSGLNHGVLGIRVGKGSTERLWRNQSVSLYLSSPVAMGDLVFGFSHINKGQLFALDPRTGQTVWTGEPRQGDNAALVTAGDYLLTLTTQAELTVARVTPKSIEPVRRYTVADSPTWAHPLVLPGGVVIKDAGSLSYWA
jgi:outer membrane protein assembly factor BamB